jgi:hypothetical protein
MILNKLPIELVHRIKSYICMTDRYGCTKLKTILPNNCNSFPKYYEKINLKNPSKLRWKHFNSILNIFYYRHSKDFFQYRISIQDYRIYTISITSQWNLYFTYNQIDILQDYIDEKFPEIMNNVNEDFVELIFHTDFTNNYFTSHFINSSPKMLFYKLDSIVFSIKKDFDQLQKNPLFIK